MQTQAAIGGDISYTSLLRDRNFGALWWGQLVSTLGDRLHQVALFVLVGSLTSQNLRQVGMVWVAIGAPSLLFGLFAGALVDRWSRRSVMIVSDLLRVPLVLAIPWLARTDLRLVYVLTFLLTTVSLFFRPARQAILPDIVPGESLMKANSFSSITDSAVDVLGYPVAGALVAGLAGWLSGERGIDLAFYIDAGTYAFSALMIYFVSASETRDRGEGGSFADLLRMVAGGLRLVRSNAYLLTNTILLTLGPLVASSANTLTYGYARDVAGTGGVVYSWLEGVLGFGRVALSYAILEGAIGVGSVLGGLAVGRWVHRYRAGPMVLLGLFIIGAGLASLSLFTHLWWATGALVLVGVGNMLALIPSVTLIQKLTPGEYLGRVFSLRGLLISSAIILANALAGIGSQRYGVRPMFAVFGGMLVAVVLVAAFLPSARNAD